MPKDTQRTATTDQALDHLPERVTVAVEIRETACVVVTDDGRGLPYVTVRSGLANLADRAERRGGRLRASGGPSGTEVEWWVPLGR